MTDELARDLQSAFPEVIFGFSQAISDNVEKAMSGVKGENTVKVIGPDLVVNGTTRIKAKTSSISCTRSTESKIWVCFARSARPNIRITPDRTQCGRYGLNVGDVEQVVQAAVGGQAVTQVYEGMKYSNLTIRWAPAARRKTSGTVRNITVPTADGYQVPLEQLAEVVEEEGPSLVYREDNRR